MKKIFFSLTIVLAAIMVSCSGGKNDPVEVTRNYMADEFSLNYSGALQYTTGQQHEQVQEMIEMVKDLSPAIRGMAELSKPTYELISSDVNSDTATVDWEITASMFGQENSWKRQFSLVQEGGKWLIADIEELFQ